MIAGLLGLSTYFFRESDPTKSTVLTIVLALAIGVPAVFAGFAYTPRPYQRPPNPEGIAGEALSSPDEIKRAAVGTLLDAYRQNVKAIKDKDSRFTFALRFALGAWILGIAYKGFAAVYEIVNACQIRH